jgi:hypothetical protein
VWALTDSALALILARRARAAPGRPAKFAKLCQNRSQAGPLAPVEPELGQLEVGFDAQALRESGGGRRARRTDKRRSVLECRADRQPNRPRGTHLVPALLEAQLRHLVEALERARRRLDPVALALAPNIVEDVVNRLFGVCAGGRTRSSSDSRGHGPSGGKEGGTDSFA